jgi:uncharacterized protein YheU (UPF0270 family)
VIEIPLSRLDDDVLQSVIEEFITREGTDYGQLEISLAQKVAQVRKQLQQGLAVVVFDEATESTSIVAVQR